MSGWFRKENKDVDDLSAMVAKKDASELEFYRDVNEDPVFNVEIKYIKDL